MTFFEFYRKSILLIAAVFTLLSSVNGKDLEEGNIEIYGELLNFKERVVQLTLRWEYEGKYYKENCVVKNSKYIFRTKLSEPTNFSFQPKYQSKNGKVYYKIVDDCNETYSFFLDPQKIKLTSSGSFANTICIGSESNTALEKYRKGLRSSLDIENEVNKIFHSINTSIADSLDVKGMIRDSLNLSEDVKQFKQNATSTLGPSLLNSLYNRGYDINELKAMYNQLSDVCKHTKSGKLLSTKLNSFTPLMISQKFDWFIMADTSGKPVNAASLEHKMMLIDLWASWCIPCRQQMKQLKQVYNKFHSKGFEVVAVSLDDKSNNWKKAIVKDKFPWVNVSDLKGWNNDLIVKYYVHSIPFNILIDQNGKVLAIDVSMDTLVTKCKDLMPTF